MKHEGQTTANLPQVSFKYTSGVRKLDDSQWKVENTILTLLKGPWACIIKEYNVWIWTKQPQQKHEGQPFENQPYVSTAFTSGVWKLDGSQSKNDIYHPTLVEGSIGIIIEKYNIWIWSKEPQ